MVFNTVSLVVGFIVTLEEALKLFDLTKEEYEEEGDRLGGETLKNLNRCLKAKLYNYPCCSDLNQKKFIVGKVVKTWVRKCTRCPNCEEYSLCDNCIGQTCQGYYPVDKILNEIVECPIENVCMYCWKDNKKKIETECEDCGHKPNWQMRFNCPQENKFEDQELVKWLIAYKTENGLNSDVKIYYMLDDCLSCT